MFLVTACDELVQARAIETFSPRQDCHTVPTERYVRTGEAGDFESFIEGPLYRRGVEQLLTGNVRTSGE